jgi:Ca-activated chloride channel family protein
MVTGDPANVQKDLDPFVAARVERSRTAQTLTEANLLFQEGRIDEARERLRKQQVSLDKAEAQAKVVVQHKPPSFRPTRGRSLDDDFNSQRAAVLQAEANFAPPPPPATKGGGGSVAATSSPFAPPPPAQAAPTPRDGKAAVKENEERRFNLSF